MESPVDAQHKATSFQENLLRPGHPYEASIYAAISELEDQWRRVNMTANERRQALQDAQKIHTFDQDADEMLIRLEVTCASRVF